MPTKTAIRKAIEAAIRSGRGSQKARAGKRADAKVASRDRAEVRQKKGATEMPAIKASMTQSRRLGRMARKGTMGPTRTAGLRKSQKAGRRQSYSTRKPRRQ